MTPNETTAILRQLIDWRRDKSNWPPSPMLVEKAIDAAIEMIERTLELEIAVQEFTWGNDNESQTDCARSVLEELSK